MKKTIILSLAIALMIASCAQQQNKFPQGSWKYVKMQKVFKDSVVNVIPEKYKVDAIKMWTENNFAFVGQFIKNDTTFEDFYGGGFYKIDGFKYTEDIKFHVKKGAIGRLHTMRLELKNDTLYLSNPADSNGIPIYGKYGYSLEKYVLIK
jgi:hypothetical protein